MENEYRIAVFSAEIDWIRRLVRRIRSDELGGIAELRSLHERR